MRRFAFATALSASSRSPTATAIRTICGSSAKSGQSRDSTCLRSELAPLLRALFDGPEPLLDRAGLRAAGGKASFVGADFANAADVRWLASEVGEIDILINNAGVAAFGPTAEFDPAVFDQMFASNVRAPFLLVAALAPGMAERGHGSIISLSSMAGGIGLVGGAAYGATKVSLEAMTRAWAAEYSASGVRVNAIAPGPVYTAGARPEFLTHSERQRQCAVPHSPRRSPRSSASWHPHKRATALAPLSPSTADVERSKEATVFDHITLRVADIPAASNAFTAVFDELEIKQSTSTPRLSVWGNFAITQTDDEHPIARRVHVAFIAPTPAHVDRFGRAGIEAGFANDGPAGPRPDYANDYYAAFLKDSAGNSFEAVHREAGRPPGNVDHVAVRVKEVEARLRSTRRSARPSG